MKSPMLVKCSLDSVLEAAINLFQSSLFANLLDARKLTLAPVTGYPVRTQGDQLPPLSEDVSDPSKVLRSSMRNVLNVDLVELK